MVEFLNGERNQEMRDIPSGLLTVPLLVFDHHHHHVHDNDDGEDNDYVDDDDDDDGEWSKKSRDASSISIFVKIIQQN